ncbi:MAG: hypothetical protein ABSF41_06400 [Pseudolabrys sp.]
MKTVSYSSNLDHGNLGPFIGAEQSALTVASTGITSPSAIRAPRRALVVKIASLLLEAAGGDLGEPIDHLGIASTLIDQERQGGLAKQQLKVQAGT